MIPEYERKPELAKLPELKEQKEKELALLYAEVFGAPPWNEAWRCSSCNKFYGAEYSQGQPSPCCSTLLTIAYPEEETIDYIREELSNPSSQIKIIRSPENQLIVFAWGYQIENTKKLAQKKWTQSEEVQSKVIQTIAKYTSPESPIFYISEVGVSPSFRGNKLGLQLTQELLDFGLSLKKPVVFRTNWASPMMRIAKRLEMSQIMGPKIEVINNEIVKTGEIAGFLDDINSDRTLFISLP